jgi:hypothetical protein
MWVTSDIKPEPRLRIFESRQSDGTVGGKGHMSYEVGAKLFTAIKREERKGKERERVYVYGID